MKIILDFNNGGDFDLDDIIKTDITFELFREEECPHCDEYIEI